MYFPLYWEEVVVWEVDPELFKFLGGHFLERNVKAVVVLTELLERGQERRGDLREEQ